MTLDDIALLESTALWTKTELERHYVKGFGIFPSADPDDNYYNQLWSRDFAHAACHYFIRENPEAVLDSLMTIFKHQDAEGCLPFRVEREYTIFKIIPGFDRVSKPIFSMFEKIFHNRNEKPLYEKDDLINAGDTIPVILITLGYFSSTSALGKEFVKNHAKQIADAIKYFQKQSDPVDSLAIIKGPYPDWADTIKKSGKLSTINIWWAEGLEMMGTIFSELGFSEDALTFTELSRKVKTTIYMKLFDASSGYFKADVGDPRLSTVASIFGSQYILDATQAERVETTLFKRVRHTTGYKNFDPEYVIEKILPIQRILGNSDYHNVNVWPWVTLQNIFVKVKIALDHPSAEIQTRYKNEAIEDLFLIAKLFKESGGAYEVFLPDKSEPAHGLVYASARNFMGSLAGYHGAYHKLKSLHWI